MRWMTLGLAMGLLFGCHEGTPLEPHTTDASVVPAGDAGLDDAGLEGGEDAGGADAGVEDAGIETRPDGGAALAFVLDGTLIRLADEDDYLFSPNLLLDGDRVRLLVAETDRDHTAASAFERVAAPFGASWDEATWGAPATLAVLDPDRVGASFFQAAFDGVRTEATFFPPGEPLAVLAEVTAAAPPSTPRATFDGMLPRWLAAGDDGAPRAFAVGDENRTRVYQIAPAGLSLVYDDCAVPTAGAAGSALVLVTVPVGPGCSVASLSATLSRLDEVAAPSTIGLSSPGADTGYVTGLRAVRVFDGTFVIATVFAGALGAGGVGHGFHDAYQIHFVPDVGAPRRLLERTTRDGLHVRAVAPVGDRLAFTVAWEEGFGDWQYDTAVVDREGGVQWISDRAVSDFSLGPPLALLGRPDGHGLLAVARDWLERGLFVARFEER